MSLWQWQFPYSGRHFARPVGGAPALDVRNLSVAHRGDETLALRNVSLAVQPGERVALVGPNGAGKSTLLKAVAGLLPVREGQILIYGLPVGACHHRVAYLPQRGEIDWHFPINLRNLVLTGRYVHLGWVRRPRAEDRDIADAMIATMGLRELADRQIGQLSGGQQQRALLARALTQDADLLLLDEPMNAVDKDTRAIIGQVLADLSAKGKTALVATHDLARLESDFDRVLYLVDGQETDVIDFTAETGEALASWTGYKH